jgi:predicted dehydrogenase
MSKVRVGVVGVGSIAQMAHLPHYAKDAEVEIVALADPETERVGEYARSFPGQFDRPEPRVFDSLAAMAGALGSQIDAVSICTPNLSHVELAREALAAGWHVLLEKPMGTVVTDVEELVSIAERSGKMLMIGQSHRYRDDVEAIKRFIDAGDLGAIYFAKTRILRRRGTPSGWFTDLSRSGGGPLMDIGVHALDLTWWLTGARKPLTVSGFLHRGIGQDHPSFVRRWTAQMAGNADNEIYTTEDFAAGFIRLEGGLALEMEVSWALNGPEDDALKVEIFGSKGGVSLDPLRFYGMSHGILTTTTPTVGPGSLYEREISHFLTCVRTGRKPLSPPEEGLQVVRMLAALGESSNLGREVSL